MKSSECVSSSSSSDNMSSFIQSLIHANDLVQGVFRSQSFGFITVCVLARLVLRSPPFIALLHFYCAALGAASLFMEELHK